MKRRPPPATATKRGRRTRKAADRPTHSARTGRSQRRPAPTTVGAAVPDGATGDIGAGRAGREVSEVTFTNLSLHDLFEQQTRTMLERADLDDEQRQGILAAMSCPCCGGGGMSFCVKLKRD